LYRYSQALGYAYILTHPGIPCIFGPHFWDRDHEVRCSMTCLPCISFK
jgi:hypothetical protein